MSALGDNKDIWSVPGDRLDSKYEKCRNITEEIYKRINITFQIKKLETEAQSDLSDHSDQIDSNDLSNETDLFACDKTDSISSSEEGQKPAVTCEKYININNNEETKMKKTGAVYKRPRKRFRKRVKKRQSNRTRSESEGSSDEALPLSRIVEVDSKSVADSPDNVMGVPNIVILTRDLKPKIATDKKPQLKTLTVQLTKTELFPLKKKPTVSPSKPEPVVDAPLKKETALPASLKKKEKEVEGVTEEKGRSEWKNCSMCSLSFRGERGLRRHMTMSHIINQEETKMSTKPEQRETTT
ncbi:hypothetical protein PYW07_012648 [Mythimna separata]|uniref:C2H2-type domain-containing protein n=1 Tax=Mythimna separata TaxID=271217 RepID=A0AAD7Y8J8_MYTSE|nr:hypothetical protein PYW07_012648 [Mythimna separata]